MPVKKNRERTPKEGVSKEEFREEVIDVAGKMFRENGIKSITMDDIAASLSMSKRTLYEMFKDKEALLKECIMRRHHAMQEYIRGLFDSSYNVLEILLGCHLKAVEGVRSINPRFFEDLKKYPSLAGLLRQTRSDESDGASVYFHMGVEQGLFRDDVNFEIMTWLFHEQINMLVHSDMVKKYSFLEVYEVIMLSYIRGLCTDKGLKLLDNYISEYRKRYDDLKPVEYPTVTRA